MLGPRFLPTHRWVTGLAPAFVAAAFYGAATFQVLALSEIQRQDLPPPAQTQAAPDSVPNGTVPLPGPIEPGSEGEQIEPDAVDPQPTGPIPDGAAPTEVEPEGEDVPDSTARPGVDPEAATPAILYDLALLPEPVRRMHRLIVEACKSGDIQALRPLLGSGEGMTQLSFGGVEGDPIAFLKGLSGDGEGHEILAILLEVLNAGYVHLDSGSETELYVWPYFFAVPLDSLTAPQRVELFTIVTAGDYEDMKNFGAYIFYRVGITPEGRWAFFVAGD